MLQGVILCDTNYRVVFCRTVWSGIDGSEWSKDIVSVIKKTKETCGASTISHSSSNPNTLNGWIGEGNNLYGSFQQQQQANTNTYGGGPTWKTASFGVEQLILYGQEDNVIFALVSSTNLYGELGIVEAANTIVTAIKNLVKKAMNTDSLMERITKNLYKVALLTDDMLYDGGMCGLDDEAHGKLEALKSLD